MKKIHPLVLCALALLPNIQAQEEREFIVGPDYSDAPETKVQPRVPKGDLREFTMDSKDSKIYKGIAKDQKGVVPYQRKVAVYLPDKHRASQEMPFIVVQDGIGYRDLTARVLDNLIHEKRVPPIVAIFINSGGGDSKGSQRGLEYDTVDGTYTKFIETEVLPEISRRYRLMAQELKAKGDDYRYVFSKNADHTDGKVTRETLPAALEWLWEGYRAK